MPSATFQRRSNPLAPPAYLWGATGNGIVAARLEGADFQFIDKVALTWMEKCGSGPAPVDFILPRGKRAGSQESLEFDVDTNTMRTGRHVVSPSQAGCGKGEATLRILPSHLAIWHLPLWANLGEPEQQTALRVSMLPWPSPSPHAPLCIWLRGEQEGRLTKARP